MKLQSDRLCMQGTIACIFRDVHVHMDALASHSLLPTGACRPSCSPGDPGGEKGGGGLAGAPGGGDGGLGPEKGGGAKEGAGAGANGRCTVRGGAGWGGGSTAWPVQEGHSWTSSSQ